MKILVIGSTGRTGLQIMEQGFQDGHKMTAFTRHPEKLADRREWCNVALGDGINPEDVHQGVKNQDAVICCVAGDAHTTDVVTHVTRNTINAMQAEDVHRLILISSNLLEATRPWVIVQIVKWILRRPLADDLRAERLVKDSTLDWTIIRPSQLTDKPATGRVRRIYGGTTDSGPYQLTRSDLASAILNTLTNTGDIGKTFDVTGARKSK